MGTRDELNRFPLSGIELKSLVRPLRRIVIVLNTTVFVDVIACGLGY